MFLDQTKGKTERPAARQGILEEPADNGVLKYDVTISIGLDRLCWHNFENNRHLKELGIMLE